MANPYSAFRELLRAAPLLVGDVESLSGGVATIRLPDTALTTGRGDGIAVGQKVFVRGGVIEGTAPSLPVVIIEV